MTKEECKMLDEQISKIDGIAAGLKIVHQQLPIECVDALSMIYGMSFELKDIVRNLDDLLTKYD